MVVWWGWWCGGDGGVVGVVVSGDGGDGGVVGMVVVVVVVGSTALFDFYLHFLCGCRWVWVSLCTWDFVSSGC